MRYTVSTITIFIWIGFVCAISFMEAWLKFRADGVTLSIGLNIGKIVFSVLNKVEWAFLLIIISELIFRKVSILNWHGAILFIPFVILILQSFWLLPILSDRADMLIQGQTPKPSYIHLYYIGIEVIKVVCLFVFGMFLLKDNI